LPTQVFPTIN